MDDGEDAPVLLVAQVLAFIRERDHRIAGAAKLFDAQVLGLIRERNHHITGAAKLLFGDSHIPFSRSFDENATRNIPSSCREPRWARGGGGEEAQTLKTLLNH